MEIKTLHCKDCGAQISQSGWDSIFGVVSAVSFTDGSEPEYVCGCVGDRQGPRVYFKATLSKESLEAAGRSADAFVLWWSR